MAQEATERKLEEAAPEALHAVPGFKGQGPRGGGSMPLTNGRIAIVMLLGAETMLFTGLVGAYIVLRQASTSWPPADLPGLPLAVTWLNTLILTISCWTMWQANRAARIRDAKWLERYLGVTALLGSTFLAIQGSEWVRLVHHGLTVQSGVFGATFYVLIGVHGIHVLGAAIWILWVFGRARRNRFAGDNVVTVDLVGIYWYYVGALWIALFALVYLS